MSNPIQIGTGHTPAIGLPGAKPTAAPQGKSFSDVLQGSLDEVTRLQQDASEAVQKLATGQTDDLAGVMTAMEKSSLAFKTLLTIRAKLMEAYDQIRQIPL